MSFTLNQQQDSTFNTQNWQEVLNKAPRRYKTNGGTAIRRGGNYFIKTSNGYKESIPQEEWQEGYMRTQGYKPVFNDETGEISGYETTKYQPELVTSRMTGQPVKTFEKPAGKLEPTNFQNLSDREVFDIAYDPANAPEGTTKVTNEATRGEWNNGGFTRVYGDSIGTDGSAWKVQYNFEPGTTTATVNRTARQTNAKDGEAPRKETRTGTINLLSSEQGVWGAPFPEQAQGFWTIDPTTGKLTNISAYKQGGYLRLQKQGGKLTEVWTSFN